MCLIGLVIGLGIGGYIGWLKGKKHAEQQIDRWQREDVSATKMLRVRLEASDGSLNDHRERIKRLEQKLDDVTRELLNSRQESAGYRVKAERVRELEELIIERDGALSRMGEEIRKSGAELAARAEQGKRIISLERELTAERQEKVHYSEETARLLAREKELLAILNKEKEVAQEKMALLIEARNTLSEQFKNLANDIFDEKTQKFNEQNRQSLNTLLNPLNEKIQNFGKLVQDTYDKDSKERLTLEQELKRLQELNAQLNHDAMALTKALTGTNNKTQGTWGEMILENVLEHSGLRRGKEYEVQVSDTVEDVDGTCRRCQPDVVIYLPENKQMVIDAKVSLTAYVRYTSTEDEDERNKELLSHISSIRRHIRELSDKRYQDLYKLNTLDFVFMFIPVEPAYLLAIQQDLNVFSEAYENKIVIVGPSTLLATLRTVSNIWRYEEQNKNAVEIAKQGGALYDKFFNFVQTLEKIGRQLGGAQESYSLAMRQLTQGPGNLVNRAEKLRELGLKTTKQLQTNYDRMESDSFSDNWLESKQNDDKAEDASVSGSNGI